MSRIMFISHVHGPVLGDENEEVVSSGKASDFFSGAVGSNLCLDKENIDLLRPFRQIPESSQIRSYSSSSDLLTALLNK